ncbi:hypothetical protein, partial [uncultured Alistipes sp.]|uniref:hypothetical protein n=1 Tax=uncultured Alistipes sp. TaxID=538949 RepID=UPI0032B18EB4
SDLLTTPQAANRAVESTETGKNIIKENISEYDRAQAVEVWKGEAGLSNPSLGEGLGWGRTC